MQATLSNKGEILIPDSLLRRYGLRGGASVILEPREGEIAMRPAETQASTARLVFRDGDVLLEAPADAPPMTPETVKRMLEDWP